MGLIQCLLWHAGIFKETSEEVFPLLHAYGFAFKEKKEAP